MIKRLFGGQINNITVAAGLVGASSLVSRFLGVFRDRILAGQFGAGETLDVYYAAFRIPDLIFNLLVLGALSAGFIPIFVGLLKNPLEKIVGFFPGKENKKAWELASNVLNILILGLLALCGLGVIFAPHLTRVIAPGFSAEKQALTASLTQIMFLSPLFLGISSVLGGILQSFKRFFVYSLAPIMYNFGIIIGALYFVPVWGIYGLAWGVVLGALLHMLIQLPTAVALGFRHSLKIDFKNKDLRKIGVMMAPRTMSLAISQINLVVITIIASTLVVGSLTIFNLANNLQSFPIGIFGISFAIAAFPSLSAAAFSKKDLVESFSSTLRQILFFIVPSTVLLITLRAQIIRVILGTGLFDWEDTVLTMNTLGFFSLSLFAQASLPLLVRVFYARHDSKTPFFIGLFSAVINVALSLWLARRLGVEGLALAFSLASILNFVLLWLALRFSLGNMDEMKILVAVIKFSAAALACGITVQGMKMLVGFFVDMAKFWGVLTQGAVAGIAGIFIYAAVCSLLRSEEFMAIWTPIKCKLCRQPLKKVTTEDQGEARGI
ncbi:MAG: murein biosynthesis integral membrane protein MurJ [Patescibacteria group bacterium]|nr:murein biosynthesis integral membrane protein MurJ [Patescibacteria group bacterium]